MRNVLLKNTCLVGFLVCLCSPVRAQDSTEPVRVSSVGPVSRSIRSITVDPQNSSTLYAVTATGLFKSNDGGTSWTSSGLPGVAITNLFIDPQLTTTIYASASGYPGYLYNSFDGGTTWNQSAGNVAGLFPRNLSTLTIDSQHQGTLYVGAYPSPNGSVFKSSDSGATWQRAGVGIPDGCFILALAIDPRDANTVYAAGYCRTDFLAVFKSTSGGTSWSEVTYLMTNGGLNIQGLAVDPIHTSTLYFTTATDVAKSTDGGRSWTRIYSGLSACCHGPVVIDSQNSSTLYVQRLDGLIYKSTNGGQNWTALNFSTGFLTGSLTADPRNSNTLFAATSGIAYKSTDGGATWNALNSDLPTVPISSALLIDPQNSERLYAATPGYVGCSSAACLVGSKTLMSTDTGKTWAPIFDGVIMAIDPQNPANLYAQKLVQRDPSDDDVCDSKSFGIFKSVDVGMSWVDTGFRDCFNGLVVDPRNPTTVYAATYYSGVTKSIDAGGSWTPVNEGLPAKSAITALAIDSQNPQILYASAGLTLFKSSDAGATWNSTALSLWKGTSISALTIDPQNTSTLYAATSSVPGGLWKSVDGGASWRGLSPSPGPAVTPTVYVVAVSPKNSQTLYAATNLGVITSADGGENWQFLASGIGAIYGLVIDPKHENTLYAGGPGGLFQIGPPTVTAIGFDVTVVSGGGSYTAIIGGLNLGDDTTFDLQLRAPGSTVEIEALNWQTGKSASHSVPAGLDTGTWIVDGARAHQDPGNHSGRFAPVSATITVAP
jgi:photosystem II stability/assembly factor-like uncharacterized protein